MASPTPYDSIGTDYAQARRPDPAFGRALHLALGDGDTLLNVGAGSGSYEPTDRKVYALEPSRTMLCQRPAGSAPAVQGVAEALPFGDRSLDACMGVLTMHHWSNPERGLREMLRVARRRIVLLTWLPETPFFWLYNYFPQLWTLDQQLFPARDWYQERFPGASFVPVPVPKDCQDGFLGAYWARPHAYLEEAVRHSMSSFHGIDARRGVERLARDLESGRWEERHGGCLRYTHLDLGYRLLVVPAG